MAARAPRHLAEPPRRFGLSPLQQVFLVAMVALAALTAVIALLTRDPPGGARSPAPAATAAAAPPTAATATTAPAVRPVRPTPGNLLADGDFERDLAGWSALGGASVDRVQGGASGRWAVAVAPGRSGDGPPGMARARAARARADTTYEASFWVRGSAGGQVLLALRELADGRVVSSDEAGYTLPGADWQQLAVEHHTRVPGSDLTLEVMGLDLPAGGRLLVDAIDLQTE
jgi:Carbohydrate binding domain